jgi:hypothetical protein
MNNPATIIELEKKFWQSIADTDTDSAQVTDSSTWIKDGQDWKCAMHTESPAR